jgi:hypothetical protein
MGWASGSALFHDLILSLQDAEVDAPTRAKIYDAMIEAFENMDWDTQQECEGEDPVYDKVLKERNPEWYEEDELPDEE